MGIADYIARLCTQTAVYWGTPTSDGAGGWTFAVPVEISCRWEEKTEMISRLGDRQGQERVSNAQVYVTQDVVEKGYLYLGTLDDFDSAVGDTPEDIAGAFPILKFEKTPTLRGTTDFLRKAYL